MQLVHLSRRKSVPWKNGGGQTRDLLLWPPGAGTKSHANANADSASDASHWALRISVAEVATSGPFSAYPGVARWFCVLQGEGVRLTLNGDELQLTPDSPPLHFDGAAAPGCTLLGGPTLDLNFMARQDAGRAEMARAVPGIAWSSGAPLRAVYARDATTLRAGGAPPLALPAGTLAFNDASRGEPWQLTGAGVGAWWLSFEPHTR